MENLQMILLLAMFGVFYFMIIRPQQRRAKEQDSFVDELQKGDRVVTSSGIIGKVSQVGDVDITIALDGKQTCKVVKGAISKEMTDAYNKANG